MHKHMLMLSRTSLTEYVCLRLLVSYWLFIYFAQFLISVKPANKHKIWVAGSLETAFLLYIRPDPKYVLFYLLKKTRKYIHLQYKIKHFNLSLNKQV